MADSHAASNESTTAQLVARYATTFNAMFTTGHTVTSPLGAWMLLAIAAPATTDDTRTRLEEILGCSAEDASRRVGALLDAPHVAVGSAAAVWARAQFMNDLFDAFSASLPDTVEQGAVPDEDAADTWASANTGGMIETFPVPIDEATAVVLATAVATDVSWVTPFETAPADELGGEFGSKITTALRAASGHDQFLATTDAAGPVAVHVADAAAGVQVISVLAGADVAASEVHTAAHEIALMLDRAATAESTAARLSLFDVELGEGAAWDVTETVTERFVGGSHLETFSTTMTAWSARDDHDISTAPGFGELVEAFRLFLRPEFLPPVFDAKQSVVASYSRVGFKAAAVTAFGMRAGSMAKPAVVTHRHATVRFNRPHAVLAVTVASGSSRATGQQTDFGGVAWAGVPVFSAWVTAPEDTPDVDVASNTPND